MGASQSTIEQEVRRLHELETAVFNDFRRDVIKKLRRQSVKVNHPYILCIFALVLFNKNCIITTVTELLKINKHYLGNIFQR